MRFVFVLCVLWIREWKKWEAQLLSIFLLSLNLRRAPRFQKRGFGDWVTAINCGRTQNRLAKTWSYNHYLMHRKLLTKNFALYADPWGAPKHDVEDRISEHLLTHYFQQPPQHGKTCRSRFTFFGHPMINQFVNYSVRVFTERDAPDMSLHTLQIIFETEHW
jgi:hypothetical protein